MRMTSCVSASCTAHGMTPAPAVRSSLAKSSLRAAPSSRSFIFVEVHREHQAYGWTKNLVNGIGCQAKCLKSNCPQQHLSLVGSVEDAVDRLYLSANSHTDESEGPRNKRAISHSERASCIRLISQAGQERLRELAIRGTRIDPRPYFFFALTIGADQGHAVLKQ